MLDQYTCVVCGIAFVRTGRRQIKGKNTHCSRGCAARTASIASARNWPGKPARPARSSATFHRLSNIDPDARMAICQLCGEVRIWATSRGRFCCSEAHRERYIRYGYRLHLKTHCERCGFVPEDVCQLDINHRDGHRANRDPENLETLCSNCHRLISKRQRAGWRFEGLHWVKPPSVN